MNLYTDLYPYIIPDIPACPQQIILQALKLSGYDFCHETETLTEDIVMSIVASQQTYIPTITTSGCQFLRTFHIKLKTDATQDFDQINAEDPERYEMLTDTTIRFFKSYIPAYSLASGMQIRLVLVPIPTATQLPTWYMNRWYQGIVALAKTRLYFQPKKPWTNFDLAQLFQSQYLKFKGDAIRERYAGFKRGDIGAIQYAGPSGSF